MSRSPKTQPTTDSLYRLADDALLIGKDRVFVRTLIGKLSRAPKDASARKARRALLLILDQDKVTRAKTARRFAVKKTDLFAGNLARFKSKEMSAIAKSCHLIQMTDGCTVACGWCYLNAQPYVLYGVSYDSIRRFIGRYGKLLPSPTRFYWASDPLDWYDGEYSYADLVDLFYRATGGKKAVVTTTSLPMGTEITFLRLIGWLDKNLPFTKITAHNGSAEHYQKNDVMKGLYYRKNRPVELGTLFDYHIKNLFRYRNVPHVMKISETDANFKRLAAIFDILRFMGISESCLSWIEVEKRDVGGNMDNIRKSGRAYAWADRDMVIDTVSMACWDSTILFPGKVGAMEMCGVTKETQRGLEFWLLEPGTQIIPDGRAIIHYAYYQGPDKEPAYLLPYLTMTEYAKGNAIRRYTHYSLRRDIQTFGLLLSKTIPSLEFTARETHRPLADYVPWQRVRDEYRKRRMVSDRLLAKERNPEVIRIVRHLTSRIDETLKV